jgi:hypothetical protein
MILELNIIAIFIAAIPGDIDVATTLFSTQVTVFS